jgi:hypothetical protein
VPYLGPQKFCRPPLGPNFRVLGIIWCGYSTLVSRDAWHNAKGISSIRSPCPEKTFKTFINIGIFRNNKIGPHFGRFLRARWPHFADSFCFVPGILIYKFRVPTSYNYENFEIWTQRGSTKF